MRRRLLERGLAGALALALPVALAAADLVERDQSPRAKPKCQGQVKTVKGLKGSPGDDVIVGSSADERINGKGGDDVICAKGGADKVKGGAGDDRLLGAGGKDLLNGGRGTDFCDGGAGKNRIKKCEDDPPPDDDLPPPIDAAPVAVADAATVAEDAPPTTIDVLTNDTDPDGGPIAVAAVTQPANGSATIGAGGSAVSYAPSPGYCNTPADPLDEFQYTLTGGSSAGVEVTVQCTDEGPAVATDDSFGAIGNTGLFVGSTRPADQAGKEIAGSLLANDSDPDPGPSSLSAEPVTNAATAAGGSITIEADGTFTYHPEAGDTAVTDTFVYRVCNDTPCGPGSPDADTATLSLEIMGQAWYVKNNAPLGGDGTSDGPFTALAAAEAASSAGDSVYVFDGDGTASGLGTGYAMASGERLIGEHAGFALDPDGGGALPLENLHPGTPGAFPSLSALNEDVVVLAAGVTVEGVGIDPDGTGGGVSGGAGAGNVKLASIRVIDSGTAGTEPGVELAGTTGTNSISDLVVSNGGSAGAVGLRLSNAGTVALAPAGTISISTAGAKGFEAAGTNLGGASEIDEITVSGSASGGVSMQNTIGTTALGDGANTDLALTTISGAAPALALASAGSVSVNSGGSDNLSASGGPALAISGTPGATLAFDQVSSSASSGDGLDIAGLAAGNFSAAGGTISGAVDKAVDIDGGSGTIDYAGAIDNGPGQTAEVTGRSGGAINLSGPIADSSDAGGGIVVSGNSGGTTSFSNASKVINSGASAAIAMSASDGHILSFSGGGLDLDTTTGTGLSATTSGRLAVAGAGNTIQTTTGTALNVANTDIDAPGLDFESISSNGAVSGIILNNTGSADGLSVTGAATAGSGGTIQSSTGAGVSLTSVGGGVDLSRIIITGGADDGIRATDVNGFSLASSSVTNNGNAVGEHGLDLNALTGNTVSFANDIVTGNAENNLAITNDSGTLSATVSGGTYGPNSAAIGNDGIRLLGTGTGTMTVSIDGATFTNNRGDHVQMSTDASTTVTQSLTVNETTMSSNSASVLGGGVTFNPGGNAVADATISDNDIQGAVGSAIVVDGPGSAVTPQPATIEATITDNTIGTAATLDSGSATSDGIDVNSNGGSTIRTLITGNLIRQYANAYGINMLMNDGNGLLDATVRGNTISNPGTFGTHGVFFRSGTTGGTESAMTCLDLGHPTTPSLENSLTGSGGGGGTDIRVRQLANTTVRLPGYAGAAADTAAAATFLVNRNNPTTTPTASATVSGTGGGFIGTGSCTLP